jgi:hypothetical protein
MQAAYTKTTATQEHKYYNNTIYNGKGNSRHLIALANSNKTAISKNIVYQNDSSEDAFGLYYNTGTTDPVINDNYWYNPAKLNRTKYSNKIYTADMQEEWNQKNPGDKFDNPLMNDPEEGDYSLYEASLKLGAVYDETYDSVAETDDSAVVSDGPVAENDESTVVNDDPVSETDDSAVTNDETSKDWFVRPQGGYYGSEDGSSYDNAWDGLLEVVWGEEGVQPGDTLWVCGLHVHDITDIYSYSNRTIKLSSGIDDGKRITIRGDYPEDNGVIWGAGRLMYDEWNNEGDGIWSIVLNANVWAGDWLFQDIGIPKKESHVVLNKVKTFEELTATPGSHYSTDYVKPSKLYIHTTDKQNPSGRISANWLGYRFDLTELEYVTFLNLIQYNPSRIERDVRLSHVRWEGCKMSYGMHSLLGFTGANDHIEVINCELSWAGNGIYNIQQDLENINLTSSFYLYKGNYIHHIGVREVNWNKDAHAIGIQGGNNGVIEDNIIENCGSGIALYAYTEQELTDTLVRRNFVINMHKYGGATGYGIFTMCNNDSLSKKTGNEFYHNILTNCPVGFRFQFEQEQKVFNNIVFNCEIGVETSRNFNGLGANINLKNNIFMDSERLHVNFYSGAEQIILNADHNLYYPADTELFNLRNEYFTLDNWKKVEISGNYIDLHSIGAAAIFENRTGMFKEPLDFFPKNFSPVIDAGIDVGLGVDMIGTSIGYPPDIGAFEYVD